MLGFVCRNSAR